LRLPPVEACDALEILKKLDTPITRIVLSLVLDVVTVLAVPRTHTDIFWDDVKGGWNVEVSSKRRKEAVHQILCVCVEGLEAAHNGVPILKLAFFPTKDQSASNETRGGTENHPFFEL
jgi:hypothetical protein